MRNLKKLLAVIITVAMLATLMVPAFAAETKTAAKICEALGMLKGTTGEVTDEYLATELTRHQMAIMFLRLRGLEAEANAFEGTDNFADADEIKYAEGRAVLAYLYANPDLGFVGSEGNFMPLKKVEAQEYFKVMLVALGYEQGEDFEWADVLEFAAEKGLASAADFENKTYLTANDVAEITVEALLATCKDGKTLVEKLIDAGVIDEDLAVEVGLIEEVEVSAEATGAKKFTVSFGTAVDENKVSFSVKKGSAVANIKTVTFAENKKSAELEMASQLTEGTYDITVKGLGEDVTLSVDVEDEKVAKIEFTSDTAPLVRGKTNEITIGYKVLNQYGEDISDDEAVYVYPGKGNITNPVSGGTATVTNTSDFSVGDKINVNIIHQATQVFANGQLTVGSEARVAQVALTKIYNPDDEELVAGKTANFYIVVEAKDQYGNVMEDPDVVEEDLSVSISNPSVATVERIVDGSGRVTYTPNLVTEGDNKVVLKVIPYDANGYAAGTSQISVMSLANGKRATFDVVVAEASKVDEFKMVAPSLFAAGDKDVKIEYTALDQFGNEMTSNLDGKVTFNTSSDIEIKFVKNYVTGKDELILSDKRTNPDEGTILITAITGTQKFVTLTINAKKPAVPSVVAGIGDFSKVYAVGAAATLEADDVVINDQYGRKVDLGDFTGYKISVETSDKAKVSLDSNADAADIDSDGVVFNGVAKGSATITLKLKDAQGEVVKNSSYTFTAKVVEKADIASYELADLGKTYENTNYGEAGKYEVEVKVNGVMSDGSKVVIPTSYYSVVINDEFVGYNSTTNKVYSAARNDYADGSSTKEVPVIVNVFAENEPIVLTKNITISKDAPKIDAVELVTNGIATKEGDNLVSVSATEIKKANGLTTLVIDAVKTIDQYGKEVSESASDYSYIKESNVTDGKALSNVVAGDTFNVIAITKTGKSISFKVVVTD
ncbi:MAG TPA: hypothetical protein GXX36_10760 [Clostridiaceae bacterium]|nr:hypothetical protein [Clostridiaceae bacterium]